MKCCKTLLFCALFLFGTMITGQSAVSQGIPRTLSVQGVLTDAFESKPLQGQYVIKTGVYESALGGIPLYEQIDTLTLGPAGLYQITLGKLKGLPMTLKFDKAYFIDLSVNGMPQTMRIPLQPAPYALMASNVAENAVSEENLAKPLRDKLFPDNGKQGEETVANSVGGLRSVIAGGDRNATTANYCSILGGFNNRVSGVYGIIGGGQDNQVTGNYSFVGGGRQNRAQATYSSISAGFNNMITTAATSATISGGQNNSVGGTFATISGGEGNTASALHSTVSGGKSNRAMQSGATVSGGTNNIANAVGVVISGGTSNTATGQNSTVSGGTQNKANGAQATIGGGTNNSVSSVHGGIFNGQNNTVSGTLSSIVGGSGNTVSGQNAIISGGINNTVSGSTSLIAGGSTNQVLSQFSAISSGLSNQITNNGNYSVISGGRLNQITGENSSIAGGISNRNTGNSSTVLGGNNNFVTGISSVVGGDRDSTVSNYTVITGGSLNEININSDYSAIGGGVRNLINSSSHSTISGGIQDTITNSDYSVIAGGSSNTIREGSDFSLIAGGVKNDIFRSDTASILSGVGNNITEESDGSLIASGLGNTIIDNARLSVIAGGQVNTITKSNLSVISGGRLNEIKYNTTSPGFSADYSVIAGGRENVIDGVEYAFIGGGRGITISRGSSYSAILSGQDGSIGTGSTHSVVVGGNSNAIGNNATHSTIGGGNDNGIGNNISNAVIAGGNSNIIGNSASYSSIGGGDDNEIQDNSINSVIAGGNSHLIGTSSSYSTISGGQNNGIGNSSINNFIGGGQNHQIGDNAINNGIVSGEGNAINQLSQYSVIGGGQANTLNAGSQWSGVFSGRNNTVDGDYSAILGGGGTPAINGNAITGNNSTILGGSKNVVSGNHGAAIGFGNTAYSDAFALGNNSIAGPSEFAASYSNGFYFKSSGLGDGTGDSGYDFENHVAVFHNPAGTNGILIKIDNACETADELVNNDNNFVTFQNINGDEVGRIEGQTIAEFGNDDEYQQELAFAILDVVVASTDVAMKGYQLVSDAMDVGTASSCIFCPQLAVPEAEDVVKAGIELGMSTAGLVSAGVALDDLINSKEDNVGVTYQSGAGDYAEYLPKLNTKEKFVSGQIVGVKGGLITKNTDNADQLMVISRKPIVLGNATPKAKAENYEKVAFLGQVPVVVTGSVKLGDYILPDGKHKGLGIAVSPENIKPEQYKQIVGIAWSESKGQIATEINVAVGLNGLSVSREVSRQNDIIAKQDEQISMLKKVLCSMNTAMSKVDAEYASTVQTLLGGDANSILDLKPGMAPANVQTKQVNVIPNPSKMQQMLMDDAQAMALYEKARGSGHPTMGTPALFNSIEKDPVKKARFIQQLKSRYNQSIYEAMGKQSSMR